MQLGSCRKGREKDHRSVELNGSEIPGSLCFVSLPCTNYTHSPPALFISLLSMCLLVRLIIHGDWYCVVPENISIPPPEVRFSKTPTLWRFQLSFIHFFKVFGLYRPHHPTPPSGNSNTFCERSMSIFWNCTCKF